MISLYVKGGEMSVKMLIKLMSCFQFTFIGILGARNPGDP